MIDFQSLVENYGYLAIVIGTFLEGETILVLAGLAAHQGYLALPEVITAAFFGSLCGDQLFFFLGRKHSYAILRRRPGWKGKIEKAHKMINQFQTPMILCFRFLYGLRTITPFVLGMSNVSIKKFVFLNGVGAIVWAVVVGTGGYAFGQALEIFIGEIKHYEVRVFVTVALLGVIVWSAHCFRHRKHD